ncbi:uncharacterized protein [Misgurnus anguillicaudatus]|uniref:uncharacterized protein n=1 Tax=Misgurnus anguillicaudatus TaxID=75329 RepID=UPI003CCF2D45
MDVLRVVALFLLLLLFCLDIISACSARKQYSSELLQFNLVRPAGVTDITLQIPGFIRRYPDNNYGEKGGKKRRKRGKRGGVRLRLRKMRLNRLPLPSMILGNVQSLRIETDELQGNALFLKDYKDCCVMAFTETWLTERDQDSDLMISGFGVPYRLDRNSEVTKKTQEGGVCLYINQRYCTSVTVRERICTPDVELLSVSLRPFYLPRVFGDEVKSVMEGDSVTLHSNLTEIQSKDVIVWKFGPQESLIAQINREANKVLINADVLDGRFRDRLQVNDQTGDLIITNITTQHTGLYQMVFRGKQKPESYRFNVIVYGHLPVPVISRECISSERSSVSNCSLLCSVLNVRDVSLSWYKGNSLLSSISVSDLNIRLSLHLEVEYQDTNTYRCVLNNTITNQTQHLNIKNLCQTCSDTTGLTLDHIVVICCVAVGCLMIVASVLIFWIYRKHRNTHQQVQTDEEEITYAETTFHQRQTHKPRAQEKDDVVYAGVTLKSV